MAIQLPQKVRVVSNQLHGSAGRILQLATQLNFQPGQLVSISCDLTGPARLYSISSAPNSANVEVIYNLVDSGNLTPGLWQLRTGDEVLLQGPRGGFVEPKPVDSTQKIWWISNGTGISPFLSLIRQAIAEKGQFLANRVLVFGCRTPDDAWFLPELIAAAQNHGLRTIICLSSPQAQALAAQHPLTAALAVCPTTWLSDSQDGVFVHFGRLTAWEGLSSVPINDYAMLCGSSLMVSDVRDILLGAKLPLGNIFAETYF